MPSQKTPKIKTRPGQQYYTSQPITPPAPRYGRPKSPVAPDSKITKPSSPKAKMTRPAEGYAKTRPDGQPYIPYRSRYLLRSTESRDQQYGKTREQRLREVEIEKEAEEFGELMRKFKEEKKQKK
ncbi:hypothetical protein Slin15195_G074520 [Septoria linicola]|uniref:Uncharacterized protein n=1 Tax=Septoria linicola TaxID=215465 RepID=A0A9Q9AXZ6_9PEZI|nr:hypothetical protein Slin15195_G074520 [Septoria linicola]